MNDGTFPGGQPYTPSHELTEEEQIRQYEDQICELETRFENAAYEIENMLMKSGVRSVDPVCIIENAAEMVDIQRRLFALENKHAELSKKHHLQ